MFLSIELHPDTEARLRARARELGQDVADLVAQAVEEKLAATPTDWANRSPDEWCAEWRAWAASHRRLGHEVDDSRESIYAGRGE